MIRQIVTLGIIILLGTGLAACKSDNAGEAGAGSGVKIADAEPGTAKDQQPVPEQTDLNGETVISDLTAWEHPVKKLLTGTPFELYKVVLTKDSTYPKFYVRYPDKAAVNESKELPERLLSIAKENGYWDYELVNEQDAITVQVHADKAAKRLADVLVNGQPYTAPHASDTDAEMTGEESGIDGPGTAERETTAGNATKLPDKYTKFVEDTGLGGSYEPVFFETADLDGDGTGEAVVAFGEGDEIPEAYVLGIRNGQVKQFGDNLSGGGYGGDSIQLVHLQDRPEPVILLGLTNDGGMGGFELYSFDGKEPVSLVYSAAAVGSGYDHMIDGNHDGKYDGYVQERGSYDVLYYSVSRKFELRNGEFVPTITSVEAGEYPSSAKEAVTQYVKLRALDDGLSPEIKQRLAELGPSLSEADLKTFRKLWEPFVEDGDSFQLLQTLEDDSNFTEQTNKKTNETTIVLAESLDDGKDSRLVFRLAQRDGRWVIVGFR